jgi:anti-anti-sigma factor
MEPFAVFVSDGNPARVRLVGEFDAAGVTRFEVALVGLDGDVEVDCSGLEFIDAAGLGALVAAHNACEERGSLLILVDPSRRVRRVMALVELDRLFRVRQIGVAS